MMTLETLLPSRSVRTFSIAWQWSHTMVISEGGVVAFWDKTSTKYVSKSGKNQSYRYGPLSISMYMPTQPDPRNKVDFYMDETI
jgi:hypothetical protein